MIRTFLAFGVAAGAALAVAGAASAQTLKMELDACQNGKPGGMKLDAQISACTKFLARKDTTASQKMIGHGQRGIMEYRSGDKPAALADFDQAIKLHPSAYAYAMRAGLYEEMGKSENAIRDFNAGLRMEPKNPSLFHERSNSFMTLKQYDAAIADADQAGELDPKNLDHQNSRCWKRVVANVQLDIARQACDAALKGTRDWAIKLATLDSRGVLNLKEKRWAEAQKDFSDMLILDAKYGRALYGRGIALIRSGKTKEGEADMAKGAQLRPDVVAEYKSYGVWP